jgi:hypothetical protein
LSPWVVVLDPGVGAAMVRASRGRRVRNLESISLSISIVSAGWAVVMLVAREASESWLLKQRFAC